MVKRLLLATLSLAAACGFSRPAHAQFGPCTALRYLVVADTPAGRANQGRSLVLYPLAAFRVTGDVKTQTKFGGLVAGEVAFVPKTAGSTASYAVGAWYFSDGDNDVYELHGKYYFNDKLGVQGGFLGSTKSGGNAYDLFLLTNFSSTDLPANDKKRLDIQLGAGVYTESSHSTSFSGFIQASKPLGGNLSLDASYWFILKNKAAERADGSVVNVDLNRFALGLGFKF